MKYIFPVSIMILQIGASVVYYYQGVWRIGTYWLAACILNFVITF